MQSGWRRTLHNYAADFVSLHQIKEVAVVESKKTYQKTTKFGKVKCMFLNVTLLTLMIKRKKRK